jgi:tetratricopeptide (TPR) repeat protein
VTAANLTAKASELRRRGQIDEALVSAGRAIEIDPTNADAQWQLALCQLDADATDSAIEPLRKVTELAPGFAPGWTKLGAALQETGEKEESTLCFEQAVRIKPDEVDALLPLAQIYQSDNRSDDEIRVRVALDDLTELGVYELNRIGILYHEKKEFYKALRFYGRVAKESTAGLFNLGLVFSTPEISQNIDAIDVWRRVLKRDPAHARAQASIDSLMPRLATLRRSVLATSEPPLGSGQWYVHYLNPIELLGFDRSVGIEHLDVKSIQKAKKLLLQEIELEGGRVAWMAGLHIDRSRAISVCEDLFDPRLLHFHHHVFQNANLSAFLSRGLLDHFVIDDFMSPLTTLELLETDPEGFPLWLSSRFAPQFDLVLTRAIAEHCVPFAECLLSGRRWVQPEDEDRCFEGARRQLDQMLVPLRSAAEIWKTGRPTLDAVRTILEESTLGRILALLPAAFYTSQQEAALLLRSISINCYNNYDDAESAKAIVQLGSLFALKSPSLQTRIAEDIAALEERIAAARKDEAHILVNNRNYDITQEGIRADDCFIAVDDVQTVRWGVVITNAPSKSLDFGMAIGGLHGGKVIVAWRATQALDEQRELFGQLTNAAFTYLLPKHLGRIRQRLNMGERFRIGSVTISEEGVWFVVKGWFTSKTVLCPWSRCKSEIQNGDVVLTDSSDTSVSAALPLHEVDNALVVHLIAKGVD